MYCITMEGEDPEKTIIRDLLEKVPDWVDRFIEVRNNVVQYDTSHDALAKAVVLFIL